LGFVGHLDDIIALGGPATQLSILRDVAPLRATQLVEIRGASAHQYAAVTIASYGDRELGPFCCVCMIGPDVPGYYIGRGRADCKRGLGVSAQPEHRITVTKEARRFSIQRHFQQKPDSITLSSPSVTYWYQL
jgi:hypothetical protein